MYHKHPAQQQQQQPTMTRSSQVTTTTTLLLLLLSLTIYLATTQGKEVVAKKDEWTLLKEGDTIPAGLHVKIDMTTGEKYVKLLNDDDDDDDLNDKNIVAIENHDQECIEEKKDQSNNCNCQKNLQINHDSYDYIAMHRALSHLPVIEKERMGGIPDIPHGYDNGDDDHDDEKKECDCDEPLLLKEFRTRMKEIWEQRQGELKNAQLSDITKELMKHIGVLENVLNVTQPQYNDYVKEDFSLLQSLDELEYLVSDVDAARDFHTLGGWSLLSSLLLSNVVHLSNSTSNRNSIYLEPRFSDEVRIGTTWVIGTAVKNIDEFTGWATEELGFDLWSHKEPSSLLPRKHVNVLSVMLNLLREGLETNQEHGDLSPKLYLKCIYAIGSLLRGNLHAQETFIDIGGPVVLANTLKAAMIEPNYKLASKFILLASDLIQESEYSTLPYRNIDSYSTAIWCDGATSLLQSPNEQLKEKSIHALRAMSPYCKRNDGWTKHTLRVLASFITSWQDRASVVDPEWHIEIKQLSTDIISILNS